jgi:hypothetical protein
VLDAVEAVEGASSSSKSADSEAGSAGGKLMGGDDQNKKADILNIGSQINLFICYTRLLI